MENNPEWHHKSPNKDELNKMIKAFMRKQFIDTMSKTLEKNKETVLLLGDIGVHGFRHAKKQFPDRV